MSDRFADAVGSVPILEAMGIRLVEVRRGRAVAELQAEKMGPLAQGLSGGLPGMPGLPGM